MTFGEIKTRVMRRTNLSSDDANTRVGDFVNERLRNVQTSVNFSRIRRGSASASTVSGVATVVPSGVIKPLTVTFPALNRVLGERTEDQLRTFSPNRQWIGAPEVYAVRSFAADSFTMELVPIPDGVYDLTIDGIIPGVDLVADGDIPVLPEDFHDILIFGALADEYNHYDKADLALVQEKKFNARVSELRYFLQKSIYLHRAQGLNLFSNWMWYMYGSPWVR